MRTAFNLYHMEFLFDRDSLSGLHFSKQTLKINCWLKYECSLLSTVKQVKQICCCWIHAAKSVQLFIHIFNTFVKSYEISRNASLAKFLQILQITFNLSKSVSFPPVHMFCNAQIWNTYTNLNELLYLRCPYQKLGKQKSALPSSCQLPGLFLYCMPRIHLHLRAVYRATSYVRTLKDLEQQSKLASEITG